MSRSIRKPLDLGLWGRGRLASALATQAPTTGSTVAWQAGRGEPLTPDRLTEAQVVVDASLAEAVSDHLDLCLRHRVPLLIAATGWQLPDLAATVGDRGAVLVAPNGSLTLALLRRFATILGAYTDQVPGAEGVVFDHHHGAKRDAPSGTASALIDAWHRGAGSNPQVACLRAGHEIGFHSVGFDAPTETLEIRHRARSRALFAEGLLTAACWLHDRWSEGHRGLFTLDDVAAAMLDPLFQGVLS